MKRILSLLLLLIVTVAAYAGPEIAFDRVKHDFGTIHASRGPVKAVYPFTNTGDAPLVIVSVTNGGCGCTTPRYTLEPVAPGKKGQVIIEFDPRGRQGEFKRDVKVKTNAKGKSKKAKLTFTGAIIP